MTKKIEDDIKNHVKVTLNSFRKLNPLQTHQPDEKQKWLPLIKCLSLYIVWLEKLCWSAVKMPSLGFFVWWIVVNAEETALHTVLSASPLSTWTNVLVDDMIEVVVVMWFKNPAFFLFREWKKLSCKLSKISPKSLWIHLIQKCLKTWRKAIKRESTIGQVELCHAITKGENEPNWTFMLTPFPSNAELSGSKPAFVQTVSLWMLIERH